MNDNVETLSFRGKTPRALKKKFRPWNKSWYCTDCGGWLDQRRPRRCGARCRECYQKHHQNKERLRIRQSPDVTKKMKEWTDRRLQIRPLYRLFTARKHRAKLAGILWNIEELDFYPLPQTCPVLGIPLTYNSKKLTDNSASLDRIEPALGYVRGNVVIISARANRIKSDGTAKEHRLLAEWIELQLTKAA